MRNWPSVIKPSLWPYALLADTKRHNELSLNEQGKSPLELFSGINEEITCSDFHTWGCPVFVLDAANQSGFTGTPKWNPRATAGVYLGHSPSHAGNVSLVLNLHTGHVSPQYHVVFDDDFSTISYLDSGETPPKWCSLVANSSEKVTDEQYDTALTWYSPSSNNNLPSHDNSLLESEEMREELVGEMRERTSKPNDYEESIEQMRESASKLNDSKGSKPTTPQPFVDLSSLGLRRSNRKRKQSKFYGLFIMATALHTFIASGISDAYSHHLESYDNYLDLNFDGTPNSTSIRPNLLIWKSQ